MKTILFFVWAFFAKLVYRLFCATLRIRVVNPHYGLLFKKSQSVVYACWHSKTFVLLPHIAGWSVVTLTLLDWKNFFFDKLCRLFGCRTVPVTDEAGATRRLLNFLKQGSSVILAVDGPKGPRGILRPGAIFLAEKVNAPIVAFRVEMERSIRFKNRWDHYEVPYPFSRVTITLNEPLAAVRDEREGVRARLIESLGSY